MSWCVEKLMFCRFQSREGSDEEATPRQLELEQRLLEATLRCSPINFSPINFSCLNQFVLRQQRIDSEKDQEWLQREETNLVRRILTFVLYSSISTVAEETPFNHQLLWIGALRLFGGCVGGRACCDRQPTTHPPPPSRAGQGTIGHPRLLRL